MKAICTILLLIGFGAISMAQESLLGQSRKLLHPVDLKEVGAKSKKHLPPNSKFTIIGEKKDAYKIYFWDWDKESVKYAKFNYNKETNSQRYFLLSKDNLEVYSEKIYDFFAPAFGTLTFPFKYRFNDKSFETTFNLSLTGGVHLRPYLTNRHVFSLLLGVGPSTVKLDGSNVSNTDVLEKGENLTTAAVTFSLSLMYQFEKVQFGVSIGVDNIFDNEKYDWKNQGKPWLSLGVGLNIFTENNSAKSKKKKQ